MLPYAEDGTILLLQHRKLEKRIFASVQSCFQAIHIEVSHKVKEATLRLFKFPRGKLLVNSSLIQIAILRTKWHIPLKKSILQAMNWESLSSDCG